MGTGTRIDPYTMDLNITADERTSLFNLCASNGETLDDTIRAFAKALANDEPIASAWFKYYVMHKNGQV